MLLLSTQDKNGLVLQLLKELWKNVKVKKSKAEVKTMNVLIKYRNKSSPTNINGTVGDKLKN